MSGDSRVMERDLAAGLSKCAAELHRTGPNRWRVELANGRRLTAAVHWEEPWLRLATALPSPGPRDTWRLLELNGTLPRALRIVTAAGRFELQAELPLLDAAQLLPRLEGACAALLHGAGALDGGSGEPEAAQPPATEAEPAWASRAGEAGWRLERSDSRWSVELDAPGLPSRGWIAPTGSGLRLWIELARGLDGNPTSRSAAGRFALALSGTLRLVRGFVAGSEPVLGFEAGLPADPGAAELDLGLAALSLACRRSNRELRALADPRVAETFLNHLPQKG